MHWKSGTGYYLPYGEMVSELLCRDRIDSVPRKVDAARTSHLISPRSPGSAWSGVNKAKVAEARAAGAMTPAGEAAIAAAEASGGWSFLDDVERLEVPDDLADALGAHRAGWDALPRSVRRGTLEWPKTARREATREARLRGIAAALAEGRQPPPGG